MEPEGHRGDLALTLGPNIDYSLRGSVSYAANLVDGSNNVSRPLILNASYTPELIENDSTPDVSLPGLLHLRFENDSATNVTNFLNAFEGQLLLLTSGNQQTTLIHDSEHLILADQANYTLGVTDSILLMHNNGKWVQVNGGHAGATTVRVAVDEGQTPAVGSVSNLVHLRLHNTDSTQVSNFLDSHEGQMLLLTSENSNTTLMHNAGTLELANQVNFSFGDLGDDALLLTYVGGRWIQVSSHYVDAIKLQGKESTMHLQAFSTQNWEKSRLYLDKSHNAEVGTYSQTQDGEQLGTIGWRGVDASGTQQSAVQLFVTQSGDATATGIDGEIAIQVSSNGILKKAVSFDNSEVSGQTKMLLYDIDTNTLQRVSVGSNDSGGSGYRVLRIPNS